METYQQTINVMDFTVDYTNFNEEEFKKVFQEYGVVVIENAFDQEFCDNKVDEIVTFFESLGTGVNREDRNSFSREKIPLETRPGLYHCLIGNLPTVWELRTSPVMRRAFSILYDHNGDFICSSDGFTLTSNQAYPATPDWPHVDQTELNKQSIQGQVVLTNTTASFICSPRSHHLHREILQLYDCVDHPGNFQRLEKDAEKMAIVKKKLAEINGTWQIPVVVPKGSIILWSSTTIHSARGTVVEEDKDPNDVWKGWRCVVYICYRPIDQFSEEEIKIRARCLLENRQSNHWSTSVMPKRPKNEAGLTCEKHPVLEKLLDDSVLVYDYVPRPTLDNPSIKELSGVKFCEEKRMISDMFKFYADVRIKGTTLSAMYKSVNKSCIDKRMFDTAAMDK